jgi:hypothetical protein
VAAVDHAAELHFAARNTDLDIAGVKHWMASETVVDVLFDPAIAALVAARPAAEVWPARHRLGKHAHGAHTLATPAAVTLAAVWTLVPDFRLTGEDLPIAASLTPIAAWRASAAPALLRESSAHLHRPTSAWPGESRLIVGFAHRPARWAKGSIPRTAPCAVRPLFAVSRAAICALLPTHALAAVALIVIVLPAVARASEAPSGEFAHGAVALATVLALELAAAPTAILALGAKRALRGRSPAMAIPLRLAPVHLAASATLVFESCHVAASFHG